MNASVGCRPMRRTLRPSFLAAVMLGAASCSVGLQGDTFHGDGFAFRIGSLPESWKRVDVSHAALAFLKVVRSLSLERGAPYEFRVERTG